MLKTIFLLVIYMLGVAIFYISGKNKRQLQDVPSGMVILCMPPQLRFTIYALSIFIFAFVMFFAVICVLSGGAKDAGMWGILCIALAFVILAMGMFFGYVSVKSKVCFNNEKIQIYKPFGPPKVFAWFEITEVKIKNNSVVLLYDIDGNLILSADQRMENFDLFLKTVHRKCRVSE